MQANYQMDKFELIIYILLVNFIIALIYLVIKWLKNDLHGGIIMFNFMIICPLIGPLYLFFSWFIYEVYFKRRDSNVNVEELSLNKERIEVIMKPDMRKALNKVSLEDVLIVFDKKSARELLLDVVREDSNSSAQAILKAVEHKDTEVSHYAASAISDIINEFKTREKELRSNYYKDKGNCELCNEYVDYLYNFLSQKILSSAEQRFYSRLFEDAVIIMEEHLPSELSGELYNKLVYILLDLEEKDNAKVWVEKALRQNENELDSYKAALRYYYNKEDRREFLLLMEKLKKSDVLLDNDMLEMVRFFSQ